ncbi:MAG: hypothetical protein WC667_09750 [Sulfurimonas sp.]|jgi:glutamyl-tRNA reductase
MQVSSLLNSTNSTEFSKEDRSVDSEYLKVMNKLFSTVAYKTRDEINDSDAELAQFKKDLNTKGATEFLKDLNEEKINALVEKYRQKLLEEQKADPSKPMDIEKMVSDFKKKLIEDLMEAQKAEQALKDNAKQSLSTSDILSAVKMTKDAEKTSKHVPDFLEHMLSSFNTRRDKEEML